MQGIHAQRDITVQRNQVSELLVQLVSIAQLIALFQRNVLKEHTQAVMRADAIHVKPAITAEMVLDMAVMLQPILIQAPKHIVQHAHLTITAIPMEYQHVMITIMLIMEVLVR